MEKSDDRFSISRIYEESWKFAYKGIIPQSYLDSIQAGEWAVNLDNSEMRSIVAVEKDLLIGTSSFCASRFSDFAGYGEIVSIYLLPEYMGKGYGKCLLKYAIGELTKTGFQDIFLWVLEKNIRARNFYERQGFICADHFLNDNIGGRDLREVQYRYHIAS